MSVSWSKSVCAILVLGATGVGAAHGQSLVYFLNSGIDDLACFGPLAT